MTALAAPQPDTPLAAALRYAARGWRVVPIKPGEKRPPMPAWQDAASADPAVIENWWTHLYANHGVGIATGRQSAVWVLDVDVAGDKTGGDTLEELEARNGKLPATVTAVTGSGGFHYFFAWPADGTDVRNNQSGKLGPGLDVRGEGGQVVAAPTIHPSGTVYRWVAGAGPQDLELAQAPGWLLELLAAEPEPRDIPRAPTPASVDSTGDDSIAAWFNDTTTWTELLTADGWTLTTTRGPEQRWTRPGKNGRDGISATVGHAGRDVLKVFTSSVAELEADGAYSRFGYAAAMHHNGDRSAAARALRRRRNEIDGRTGHDDLAWAQVNDAGVVATPDNPAPATEIDHGWHFSDLAAVLAADYQPIRPTILTRADGAGLFYEQRVNGLWGESGSAKSWLAQLTAAQVLEHGDTVLYVDHEDTDRGQVERLQALGVDPDVIATRFLHINPQQAWNHAARAHLAVAITEQHITLAVIDSTGEAMASDGINPNADEEVARWHHELPKFLTTLGVTVVLIDHVPKTTEGGKLFAIGSQRKRAAITGAAYMVEAVVSPAKDKDGHLKLTCAKDRHGTYPRGSLVADADVKPTRGGRKVAITLRHHEKTTRPTVIMARISDYLVAAGPGGANQREIDKAVSGKSTGIRLALTVLIDEGYISQEVRGGSRGFRYTSIRPFEDDSMDMFVAGEPAETTTQTATASPRPDRVPTASPQTGTHNSYRVPRVPPPYTKGADGDAVDGSSRDAGTGRTPTADNPEPQEDTWGLI